ELVEVLAKQREDLLARGRHEPPHLLVDQPLRLLGDAGRPGQQRSLAVLRNHGHRADRLAHAPAADHPPRDLGARRDSRLRARRLSAALIITLRSAPSTIFSSASVKSGSSTWSWPRRAARSAASLTRFARSAPTMPGVVEAIPPRSTSPPSGTPRVCTRRIASRPLRSGGCTATRRSKRPGRSS